jgi:hypothetical protein
MILLMFLSDTYAKRKPPASKKLFLRYPTIGRGWSIRTNRDFRGCSLFKIQVFGAGREDMEQKNRGLAFQKSGQLTKKYGISRINGKINKVCEAILYTVIK